LPSVESRAVVGDFEKKPHAWASSQPWRMIWAAT
jgi:hypothetical protein